MSFPYLSNAILTQKVNPSYSDRLWSETRQNPQYNMCVQRDRYDMTGREACADSLDTKFEGCHSSTDRLTVENDLRPSYSSYVYLSPSVGVTGRLYDNEATMAQAATLNDIQRNRNPSFASNLSGQISGYGNQLIDYATMANAQRNGQRMYLGYANDGYAMSAGNYAVLGELAQ